MLANRYKQHYVVVNIKHSTSIMVWVCFTGTGGRGSLYFLPPKTTMNGQRYMDMKEKLVFWMRHHQATHFLQDGAPCHTSKSDGFSQGGKDPCDGLAGQQPKS
jgi:hypothetical protein